MAKILFLLLLLSWGSLALAEISGCRPEELSLLPKATSSENQSNETCSTQNTGLEHTKDISNMWDEISKESAKRELFEKLRQQALSDQVGNLFKAWNLVGYGFTTQEWKESSFGCMNPQKMIQERNAHYAHLTPQEFHLKKQTEFQDFKSKLIYFGKHVSNLENELSNLNQHIYSKKLSAASTLPPAGGASPYFFDMYKKQIEETVKPLETKRDFLQFQIYEIYSLYPILKAPMDTKNEKPLISYLTPMASMAKNDVDPYIKKGLQLIWNNADDNIDNFCSMPYSEENLKLFLSMDSLRDKTLADITDPQLKKVACEMIASMHATSWVKPVVYIGGIAVACTAGWIVTGPVACLTWGGVAGAVVGGLQTYDSIQDYLAKNKEQKLLHDFFLSSVEGSSLVSAELDSQALQELKDAIADAWISGIFSAADLGMLATMGSKGLNVAKNAIKGLEALKNVAAQTNLAMKNSFRLASDLLNKTQDTRIFNGLMKLFQEASPIDIARFNEAMSHYSQKVQTTIFKFLERQPYSKLKRLECF